MARQTVQDRTAPRVGLLVGLVALAGTLLPAQPGKAATPSSFAPPRTIVVCTDSQGPVEVDFKEYVKTVLPYEYDSSLGAAYREYFEAGAVAVKTYAWFHYQRGKTVGGGACHVDDDGSHQWYRPGHGRRTAVTNRAVEDTWHLRLEEDGTPAFAQYCSQSCSQFPAGRHLNQIRAQQQARDGWSMEQILGHAYRDLSDYRLGDWRRPFAQTFRGTRPYAREGDLEIPVQLASAAADDPGIRANLLAHCTIDGRQGLHYIQRDVVPQRVDGAAHAVYADTDRLEQCTEPEIAVRSQVTVNGWEASVEVARAWVPWQSAEPRETSRVAPVSDPVQAAIRLSQRIFADTGGAEQQSSSDDGMSSLFAAQDGGSEDSGRAARAAVLARADKFPDALAATGLAGADAPILLNPGGPDSRLDPDVEAELNRILDDGDLVHLVGGELALSKAVEDELDKTYTVRRHGGADRVETALLVADAVHGGEGDSSTVLVARAWPDTSAGWADAVTVGGWAAAQRHPVLVTPPDELSTAVETWVESGEHGVEEVVLLGGPVAISADAEERIDGVETIRVAGPTRKETAAAVAERLWSREDSPAVRGALLVDTFDGTDWPYALAAAVLSANEGAPELATSNLIPQATGDWLDARPDLPVAVVGGDPIVPPRVETDAAGG